MMTVEEDMRTKLVIRRLPQKLTEDEFKNMISPIPPHDYFRFCKFDSFSGNNASCRAYINFTEPESAKQFIERFGEYVFVDAEGNESAAEVDYAVNQDTPKTVKSLRDVTQGTINEDINYKKFLKSQKENAVNADDIDEEKPPWETMLEEIEKRDANPISVLESETTLLRFLSLELESRHRRKAKSASKRSAKGGKVGRRARQKLAKSPSTTESVKEESELPPSHEPPVNPPKTSKDKPGSSRQPPRNSRRSSKNPPANPNSDSTNESSENGSSLKPRGHPRSNKRGRGKHPSSYSSLHARSAAAAGGDTTTKGVPSEETDAFCALRKPRGVGSGRGRRGGPPKPTFSRGRGRGGGGGPALANERSS